MIFTTKAEYGVRLLVELGRQHDGTGAPSPVSLKAIAEAEALPLAYLERIVALLKKAGLVEATRCAPALATACSSWSTSAPASACCCSAACSARAPSASRADDAGLLRPLR